MANAIKGKTLARILAATLGVGLAISLVAMARSWADRNRQDWWFADQRAIGPSAADGALPQPLPADARDIFLRRDTRQHTVWGRFELEPTRRPALEREWHAALVDPPAIADPGRLLWWPRMLSGRVTRQQLRNAGLESYRVKHRPADGEADGWMFVDWRAGTAYYWLPAGH